ncbi:MAG: hypothetical protein H0U84_07075 [Thermoleophilaceae bacterium]|nr:hypothetical protein [Thermoleophilaceae bacterium]
MSRFAGFATTAVVALLVAVPAAGAQSGKRVGRAKLADTARNAHKVDGISASRRPRSGRLLALDRDGKFPASVFRTNLDTTLFQSRLDRACPVGQAIRAVTRDGTVTCQTDRTGILSITAGNGLSGGGTSSSVALDIAPPLSFSISNAAPVLSLNNNGAGGGLLARTYAPQGYAVFADNPSAAAEYPALYARTAGAGSSFLAEVGGDSAATAVWARAGTNTASRAGVFEGDVRVNGNLEVTGTIGPPLPGALPRANASSTSPAVLDGLVRTGRRGYATVTLPRGFVSQHRSFRYQLTTIRSFARAIVWREVRNGGFAIRTRAPRVKVSWQVTGTADR